MLMAFICISMFVLPASAVTVVEPGKGERLPDATAVSNAMNDFKSLSKKEKRERIKLVKKTVKDYKAAKSKGEAPSTNTLLLVLIAILLPPLAVYLHEGTINSKFWISLILTLLFYIPGLIYSLIVILS